MKKITSVLLAVCIFFVTAVPSFAITLCVDDQTAYCEPDPRADMVLDFYSIPVYASNGTKLEKVIVHIDYRWTAGQPVVHRGDGVSVNWDASAFCADTDSFTALNYVSYGGEVLKTAYLDRLCASFQGGLGYDIIFPRVGDVGLAYTFYGHASFELIPTGRMGADDNSAALVKAEYCHNGTAASLLVNIGL